MRLFGLNCLIGLNHFVVCAWILAAERDYDTSAFSRHCVCVCAKYEVAWFLLHLSIEMHSEGDYKQTNFGTDIPFAFAHLMHENTMHT